MEERKRKRLYWDSVPKRRRWMKIINVRGAVSAVLIALCLFIYPSAGEQVNAEEYNGNIQTPDMHVLRRIEIVDLPASTQILLEAGNSLKYTSFTLMDPPRRVVALTGVSLGEFTKPIMVGKGAVLQIDPVQADTPVRIARLNIKLSNDKTVPQIFSKSNVLIIDIPTMMPVQSDDEAPVKPRLNMVRELIFNESGDKDSIKIIADNEINADTFIVEGDKLVVDVRDADNSIKPYERVVDSKLISKIRIGVHTEPLNKVRFVADLRKAIKYDVNKQGKEITVNVYSREDNIQPPVQIAAVEPAPSVKSNSGDTKSKVNPPVVEASVAPEEKKAAAVSQAQNVTPVKNNGQLNVKKVSLDFHDADVVNVLRLLAEVSKLNMIIGDNVKGKITIKMLDIPWDQALTIILKMKGLGKIYENNVLRIDTLANIAQHEEILNLLKTLDRPTPQVLIEARIVQADTNFAKDLGVQWGGNYASNPGDYNMGAVTGPTGTVSAPSTGFAVNLPASGIAGSKGSVGFTIGKTVGDAFNLDLRLSAGETKGLTKILSAPKIATLDNREAIIQQGESIPYKTYSQEGTKTEFIDAALTLKVTPKVTPDGHISMNIKITKNRQGSIVVEGTPSINKKEATTEVLVKDGETTVIGGIYELSDSHNVRALPWTHHIPVLGWLFKNTSKSNIKSELLIFITPKIIPVTL